MKGFINKLFCFHEWQEVVLGTPGFARIGLKEWECPKCGKVIAKDSRWVPINPSTKGE